MLKIKPTLFIGSSSESLHVAEALREQLTEMATVNLWSEAFKLGENTIEALFHQLDRADYAVLIATGDDLTESRGVERLAPRDNVVFEAGFFMARLGRRRAFILCDNMARPKLPSDLAGITYATFDSANADLKKALEPATQKLKEILSRSHYQTEVDFIKAYLTVIHGDIKLSDTYADILNNHLQTLISEVNRLKSDSDWNKIIKVKERIREFFEYTGRYEDGARMGKDYVLALQELGKMGEALWSIVKDVGYMLILADRHDEGRAYLKTVIETSEDDLDPTSRKKLLYYTYRYMGISYMREDDGNFDDAQRYFDLAAEQIRALDEMSRPAEELNARLMRNFGNLELERGNYTAALQHYRESLLLFENVKDPEHIGITHLAIAKAINKKRESAGNATPHLAEAQKLFTRIV